MSTIIELLDHEGTTIYRLITRPGSNHEAHLLANTRHPEMYLVVKGDEKDWKPARRHFDDLVKRFQRFREHLREISAIADLDLPLEPEQRTVPEEELVIAEMHGEKVQERADFLANRMIDAAEMIEKKGQAPAKIAKFLREMAEEKDDEESD